MGKDMNAKRVRNKKSSDTSSHSSSSDSESPERRRKSRRSSSQRERSSHRRIHQSQEDTSRGESKKRKGRTRDKDRKRRHKQRSLSSSSDDSLINASSSPEDTSRGESKKRKGRTRDKERKRRHKQRSLSSSSDDSLRNASLSPESLVRVILQKFPDVASDLSQLLQMVDSGQGVDISGIPDSGLVKLLKKLFKSLKLKQNENGIFLLPPKSVPASKVISSTLCSSSESKENGITKSEEPNEMHSPVSDQQTIRKTDQINDATQSTEAFASSENVTVPKPRFVGPQMPSRELLDAAAKLTEAETLLREAETDFDADDDTVIGPPPPAMVVEAESANEAERFEEVARITEAEVDKPYDVLGVNWKTPSENIKKRYWKLSLMVHPDKCSHPQAHQAFVKLNQAFKELQDTDKKHALDEKIRLKEEQEQFMAELRSLREAAQWRRLQGISIEGDEELLEVTKDGPKRDEWMTSLPPERKPGMTMQSATFSKANKEGRGDTSVWTDSPLDKVEKSKQTYLEAYSDKAEKARQAYLEAYKTTISLAETDERRKTASSDSSSVNKNNSTKRSVSMVQKHQQEITRPKKSSKQREKEEWDGLHPWKPWDREKDLTAGRMNVKLDPENIGEGLSSRFSAGTIQKKFL